MAFTLVQVFQITGNVRSMTLPIPEDFPDQSFRTEEFEYFYNMELVEKLSLLNDTSGDDFSVLELKKITDVDEGNHTQVDEVLNKLENHRKLIEEVIEELELPQPTILKKNIEEDLEFSASMMYDILYWIFLFCFIAMLIISVVITGKYFLENPKPENGMSATRSHNRATEFVFIPGK